jgi:hypothetical protein
MKDHGGGVGKFGPLGYPGLHADRPVSVQHPVSVQGEGCLKS